MDKRYLKKYKESPEATWDKQEFDIVQKRMDEIWQTIRNEEMERLRNQCPFPT